MKQRKSKKHRTPSFIFTLETIKLTETAIAFFEQLLQQANHQEARVLFAEEKVKQVKSKLDTIKKTAGLKRLTSFDYNDKIIVIQSLRLYSVILLSLPVHARHRREIQQCQRIATYFEAENARARPERSGKIM